MLSRSLGYTQGDYVHIQEYRIQHTKQGVGDLGKKKQLGNLEWSPEEGDI